MDPFISTLHDLITVCTDIMDTSPSSLTSRPGIGGELVRKVQEVGRAWDEHPDWYGRTWYITVLLAVATLARVVEWFEAERVFWRWEEEEGEAGEEEGGLTFVLRPEYDEFGFREDSVPRTPVALTSTRGEEDNPLRLEKGGDRRSRDERVPVKDLRGGMLVGDQGTVPLTPISKAPRSKEASGRATPAEPISRDYSEGRISRPSSVPQSSSQTLQPGKLLRPSSQTPPTQSVKTPPPEQTVFEPAEHLRLKADKAKSLNILMELNLDGEHFLYINRTWADVIG